MYLEHNNNQISPRPERAVRSTMPDSLYPNNDTIASPALTKTYLMISPIASVNEA